ncbi:MAG TPA: hypothetical protein DCY81_02165 [Lachnospiraceae bacterium]|nr:hypothetical protein [Lachnospiraceae bacterium]
MRNKLIIITFILYLAVFTVGSIILKDRDFSDMENRTLKSFPEFSAKTVASGKFMSEFEDYLADQIIFKDDLVKLDTTASYLMGQRKINGVYFTDNDMIVQDYQYDEKILGDNIRYINEFKEAHPELPVNMLVTATASYIYRDKLPYGAPIDDQKKALELIHERVSPDIKLTDATDALYAQRESGIFFSTDHHWTQSGAAIAYNCLADDLGIVVPDYLVYEDAAGNADPFFGTLYSKAPLYGVEGDKLSALDEKYYSYHVDYMDEGWEENSLLHRENLEIKDKYTVFLDGNHSIIHITSDARVNPDSDNDKPILIVKDSYAHALIPFLAANYRDIYVVDLRYYHDSVSKLIEEKGIVRMILINNIDFLTTDTNYKMLY